MKRLVDVQIIQTVHGGVFELDEGCTGKVLVDNNNYFEGVVREHGSIADDSFVFGYMEEDGNIDFMKVVPKDLIPAERIVGGSDGISYQGNRFVCGDEGLEEACGVVVFAIDGERTRTITEDEIGKLDAMIAKTKKNLGIVGSVIYSSTYNGENVKQNVKR